MKSATARRAGLGTLAAGALAAAVVLPASAAPAPTACSMVKASEYRSILGKPVVLKTGEGSSSCQVWQNGTPTQLIPNLNPNYPQFATFMKKMLATTPNRVRLPNLGKYGYAVTFTSGGDSVYAGPSKHGLIVQFQSTGGIPRAKLIKLATLAYSRS